MIPLLSALLPIADKVLDKVIPDTEARDAAKLELQSAFLKNSATIEKAAADVVLAEAKSDHWLTANWRPLLMLLFGLIIANNYVIAPIFGTPYADIPPDMWDLLKLGVGGYVVGRSAEKGLQVWKDK